MDVKNPRDCVLLCRVSSKDQEETGYSLPAQERLLGGYAERNGLAPVKTFFIAESATGRTQRKIFNEMLAFLKKNRVRHLVCEKVDRLTRNFKDAVTIDEWLEQDESRQVHLVKDSLTLHKHSRSQEKLNWGIRLIFAKNYSDNLSEEVRKSREEKFAQGIYPGPAPYGYKSVPDPQSGGRRKMHVIDPEIAPCVRQMFDLVDRKGYSMRKLAEHFEAAGIRARSGQRMSKTNLNRYLTDPYYFGAIEWDGKRGPGIHEPLISRAQWERVQTRLRRSGTAKYSTHFHLFKGLIRCGGCGGVITWEIQKGFKYGHCNHHRDCPDLVWVKEPQIAREVQEKLMELRLSDPAVAAWIGDALSADERDGARQRAEVLRQARDTLTRIEQRLSVLYDDRLDGRITAEVYDARAAELNREKARLEEELARQQRSNGATGTTDKEALTVTPSALFARSQRAPALFAAAEPDEQRELVQEVFSGMTLLHGRLQAPFSLPFTVLAEAVATTNRSKIRADDLPATPSFELLRIGSESNKKGHYAHSCPAWRDRWDDFRKALL